MTCNHHLESMNYCLLAQFFDDHMVQGIFNPALPYLKQWYRPADLKHRCGVFSDQGQCPGKDIEIKTLDISDEAKKKYEEYKTRMLNKYSQKTE